MVADKANNYVQLIIRKCQQNAKLLDSQQHLDGL